MSQNGMSRDFSSDHSIILLVRMDLREKSNFNVDTIFHKKNCKKKMQKKIAKKNYKKNKLFPHFFTKKLIFSNCPEQLIFPF